MNAPAVIILPAISAGFGGFYRATSSPAQTIVGRPPALNQKDLKTALAYNPAFAGMCRSKCADDGPLFFIYDMRLTIYERRRAFHDRRRCASAVVNWVALVGSGAHGVTRPTCVRFDNASGRVRQRDGRAGHSCDRRRGEPEHVRYRVTVSQIPAQHEPHGPIVMCLPALDLIARQSQLVNAHN